MADVCYLNIVRKKCNSLKEHLHLYLVVLIIAKAIIVTPSDCRWQSFSYWIVSFLDDTSKKVYLKIMSKRYEKRVQSKEAK